MAFIKSPSRWRPAICLGQTTPSWGVAYNHYTPEEYRDMRDAGADSVRLQIAQVGADPQSSLFDPAFLEKALQAIRSARYELRAPLLV
jgi:hypothetical protein